jgi:cytochrome c
MRMVRIKTAKPAWVLCLLSVQFAAGPAFAGGLSDKGEILITKNCARCHAIGATGESTHKEAPPFRQVVTRYPLENLAEALAEGIVSGHPDMPEFVFQPDEIDAILAFLGKLKTETHGTENGPKSTSH